MQDQPFLSRISLRAGDGGAERRTPLLSARSDGSSPPHPLLTFQPLEPQAPVLRQAATLLPTCCSDLASFTRLICTDRSAFNRLFFWGVASGGGGGVFLLFISSPRNPDWQLLQREGKCSFPNSCLRCSQCCVHAQGSFRTRELVLMLLCSLAITSSKSIASAGFSPGFCLFYPFRGH